ncbi:MAG: insulinase family protein, partial [Candidatus Eisenbacteria bacterium]|nr:insulinase family protein [Candidatus Latescibacterota bacterium]MBD3303300.1 insulinase family protein [Candidatus Eisenbacteria bacterium]
MSRPGREPKTGDPIRHRLENGLLLLVLPRRHLPTFTATLIVPAGTAVEPETLPGAAFFCSQMLPLGTRKRPAKRLADEVEGLGGALGSGCDYDYSSVEVSGLSKNTGPFLDILADVALRPAFEREEIERRRVQILGLLERR